MLRLRPSELTLTPDDVEETFRRIAIRQTSRATPNLPSRPTKQPGRPILRRGAQRSTRDAITALGSIPILQPQQATFSSVEEEEETEHTSSQEAMLSTDRDDTEGTTSSSHERETEPLQSPASPTWSLPSPVSPPRRTMHLPFRFGRSRRTSTTQSLPDAVVAVSRTPTRAPLGHARLGSTGTSSIGDTSNNSTLSPSGGSTESTSGLRGGGDRVRDIVQDAPHAPSPLHQMQRLSSPAYQQPSGDPTKSPVSPRVQNPTLYLEGYIHDTPNSTTYHVRESDKYRFWSLAPHSEPRRGSDRQPSATRSSSTGAAMGSRVASQAQAQPDQLFEDVFRTLPAAEPPARQFARTSTVTHGEDYHPTASDMFYTSGGSLQPDQADPRSRHFSSDASAASAKFSYYGSLASSTRFPSSEASLGRDLSRVRPDGAAVSNESHRLYTPGNPFVAQLRPSSGSSAYSSSSRAGSGPHGLSPLPSMPYNRIEAGQPVPHSYTGAYIDATTAVVGDLESPLDPYAQHYQQQLQAQAAREEALQQHALRQQAILNQRFPSQSHAESFQSRRSSHGQGSQPRPPPQFPNNPRMPYHHLPPQQSLQPLQYPSERTATMQSSQFGVRGGRGDHRSGENDPVSQSTSRDLIAHHGRVQAQRAAFERLHNPRSMQVETAINTSRRSLPQTTVPYDRSNQPRDYAQRAPTQPYRPLPGARHLHSTRDSPLTALALDQGSGTTSRRSRSPLLRARTHRRIPPEQRDQENDGDRSLMRREEENVNARYGEEEQRGARMDETPPRIGRVERRMLD
ncbi:hypothetical protein BKA58DRAFT_371690 [Alternaria rosae]|uniref:uncharacterized protein n=1 Tax=Alternaria rosae TaxID=1187941 RepID=UPI001E8D5921|nr:uncharacterized protein BKA58DRAFT_371690 [Alternaria rosae]KAH6881505.1 hypothetical protein BKA58DRAFT_371690 [Alternaria rosae]